MHRGFSSQPCLIAGGYMIHACDQAYTSYRFVLKPQDLPLQKSGLLLSVRRLSVLVPFLLPGAWRRWNQKYHFTPGPAWCMNSMLNSLEMLGDLVYQNHRNHYRVIHHFPWAVWIHWMNGTLTSYPGNVTGRGCETTYEIPPVSVLKVRTWSQPSQPNQ